MATSCTNNGEWERVKGKDGDDNASNAVTRLAYCEPYTSPLLGVLFTDSNFP